MSESQFIPTPYCTPGPFFPKQLSDGCGDLTSFEGRTAQGRHIVLTGRVLEKGNVPTLNTVVEIWQADANGVFRHPLDPRSAEADPGFFGWGRDRTDREGRYRFKTVVPGAYRTEGGVLRCPHINVMISAIGLMRRLVTTIFFADEPDAVDDPVLNCVPKAARRQLFPVLEDSVYRFDIVLQGESETPFFLD